MIYTYQQGEKGMIAVLSKPSSELLISLYVGICGTFE